MTTSISDYPRKGARVPVRFFVALLTSAFLFIWPWELAVIPAYDEVSGWDWFSALPHCTAATVGDALVTLGVYGIGALASGSPGWGRAPRWNGYLSAAVLGAVAALSLEWRALATGRWSYSGLMPIVPGLGVGLLPFLQLPLLVPLAFWAAAHWDAKDRGQT
jgi:hypothetical protein